MAAQQVAQRWLGPGRRAAWRRRVVRRGLAALLAALAAFVVVQRLVPDGRVAVVAAARDLPGGVVLTAADVTTRSVPPDLIDAGARSTSDVVGRRLGLGVRAGELVTLSRLVPSAGDDSLPAGTVPVHVRAGDPAALDLIGPGDRVAVHPLVAQPQERPVAEAALVLSVDPPVAAAVLATGSPQTRGAVLALSPAQASELLHAAPDPLAPLGAHLFLVPGT